MLRVGSRVRQVVQSIQPLVRDDQKVGRSEMDENRLCQVPLLVSYTFADTRAQYTVIVDSGIPDEE
jgi:hypothetical protein